MLKTTPTEMKGWMAMMTDRRKTLKMAVRRQQRTPDATLHPGPGSLLYQTPVKIKDVRDRTRLVIWSHNQPKTSGDSPTWTWYYRWMKLLKVILNNYIIIILYYFNYILPGNHKSVILSTTAYKAVWPAEVHSGRKLDHVQHGSSDSAEHIYRERSSHLSCTSQWGQWWRRQRSQWGPSHRWWWPTSDLPRWPDPPEQGRHREPHQRWCPTDQQWSWHTDNLSRDSSWCSHFTALYLFSVFMFLSEK